MNNHSRKIQGVLILADQSSEWKVAGLRQLDRLALALNEYVNATDISAALPVCVAWIWERRRLPQDQRLTRLLLTEDVEYFSSEMAKGDGAVLVMNTRVVVDRGGFIQIIEHLTSGKQAPALLIPGNEIVLAARTYSSLTARVETARPNLSSPPEKLAVRKWYYLYAEKEIGVSEKQLLQNTGKSQDGLISRFVNRPISRRLTRFLVRFPLLPNQWTLMLTVIPLAGSILLLRGDYFGFALGAILFELQSVLDGCDGEIARLKYLESSAGQKLDGICDRFATLLYAVSLGIGLSYQPGIASWLRWFYPAEGLIAALLIGVGETLLSRTTIDKGLKKVTEDSLYPRYLKDNRGSFNTGDQLKLWMIKNSGMLRLGEGLTSFFGQATKRDVFNFGFMLLALCGLPHLILHILAICAGAIAVLAFRNLLTPALDASRAGRPPTTT